MNPTPPPTTRFHLPARLVLAAWMVLLAMSPVGGAERIVTRRDNKQLELVGKAIVEAEDGGMLLLDRQGTLWLLQPEDILRRDTDDEPFHPCSPEELARLLELELPRFRIHRTAHYMIAYNTTPAFAEWCGALYERLYRGFHNYWSRRQIGIRNPEQPLVAVVFADKESYQKYAEDELGDARGSIIGYYSFRTNRVAMYDLTGADGLGQQGKKAANAQHVNRILAQPAAERTVATIIHEATHQLALNCGLQARYADVPLWLSEGLAVYFETPDLESKDGWRQIGAVNRVRLAEFRAYLGSRPRESLVTLLRDNARLRDAKSSPAAYAEAWAFNYYLIKRREKDYLRYLKLQAAKEPLAETTGEQRLREFGEIFGQDLDKLDADFQRFMAKLK